MVKAYDRNAAVLYAHQWAYDRNPNFYNYEKIGGDCTNFASQCIFAGSGIMNYTPTFGWYYLDANRKAPAWTGVEYLYQFLNRKNDSVGPKGTLCSLEELEVGDIVQIAFNEERFHHCPIVVSVSNPISPETILVAAHSYDADHRPLSTYAYQRLRPIHITGVIWP